MTPIIPRVLLALLLAVPLAGCFERRPPDLPPVFSVDQMRYWFEGDNLVVNVTFTNRANFTPGLLGTFSPYINVLVTPEKVNGPNEQVWHQTSPMAKEARSIEIVLDPQLPGPWRERWNRSTAVGPILIPPGRTLQVEVEMPMVHLEGDEGYYYISVDLLSDYPRSYYKPHQSAKDETYFTGCFNHDLPEFYGIMEDKAACRIWDCSGERTETWGGVDLKHVNPPASPVCRATKAIGPYPSRPPAWG
jgi:hypothetical protein